MARIKLFFCTICIFMLSNYISCKYILSTNSIFTLYFMSFFEKFVKIYIRGVIMKFSKIFLLIVIFFLTGCDSLQDSDQPSTTQNMELNSNMQTPSADRLAYTEDAKRLLSGDFSSDEDAKKKQSQNEYAEDDANNDPSQISTYSTKILTNDENRYNNIKIVADKLNGFILNPGQSFSFNNELRSIRQR